MSFKLSNFWKNTYKNAQKAIKERESQLPDLPANTVELLEEKVKTAISIHLDEKKSPQTGDSKIGGSPDVTSDFEWPMRTGTDWESCNSTRYYVFFAQVNLKDICLHDDENLLPSHGLLLFFYDYDGQYLSEVQDKLTAAKIVYYPDISELEKGAFPKDYPQNRIIAENKLAFQPEDDFPKYDDFLIDHPCKAKYANRKPYREYLKKAGYSIPDTNSQLLGYPHWSYYNVEMGSYCASQGYKYLDAIQSKKKHQSMLAHWREFVTLLQLDTKLMSDLSSEMQFADMGKIFFCLKKSDLKDLNFSHVYFDMQGG